MIADMRDAANVQTCGHQFSGGDDNEGSVSYSLTLFIPVFNDFEQNFD